MPILAIVSLLLFLFTQTTFGAWHLSAAYSQIERNSKEIGRVTILIEKEVVLLTRTREQFISIEQQLKSNNQLFKRFMLVHDKELSTID